MEGKIDQKFYDELSANPDKLYHICFRSDESFPKDAYRSLRQVSPITLSNPLSLDKDWPRIDYSAILFKEEIEELLNDERVKSLWKVDGPFDKSVLED